MRFGYQAQCALLCLNRFRKIPDHSLSIAPVLRLGKQGIIAVINMPALIAADLLTRITHDGIAGFVMNIMTAQYAANEGNKPRVGEVSI